MILLPHVHSLNWCCKDDGCFLLTSVDVLREELRMLTKHPQKQREVSIYVYGIIIVNFGVLVGRKFNQFLFYPKSITFLLILLSTQPHKEP